MEAYFAEDLQGFRQSAFGYNEETCDDEAFMADLEKLLGHYSDHFSVSFREQLSLREIELVPQDVSSDVIRSREFDAKRLLTYDPEQSRAWDHLSEVLSEGHMTMFLTWCGLHRSDFEEYVLRRLTWLAEDEGREIDEPQVHDPIVEVVGKSGKYIMAYSITWVDRLLGSDSAEFLGEATFLVEFILEKAPQWRIVAVNYTTRMDMDVPMGGDFIRR